MSIDEYLGQLRARGCTVFKRTDNYLILETSSGDKAGLPAPEGLTPDQREEELQKFFVRNMLT